MTPFASWPRWLQTLTLALVLAFTYLALLLGQGWGTPDVAAARSPLAARFEASPQDWLRRPLELSVFEADLAARRVREVGVDGARVLVTRTDGGRYSTTLLALPGDAGAAARLGPLSREQGFALTALALDGQGAASRWGNRAGVALERLLLLVLVVGAAAVVLHRVRTGSAASGRAGLATRPDTCFDDVVGASEAKAALQQVAAFLRSPDRYRALGARPPRGVLLEGPPGTGKTLLARALAGECGASFIAVDGSYFSSMFYGAGIAKVRELFATARRHAPCIVFIDEFDGIGRRTSGASPTHGGGSSEENRIINKLLVELDGFDAKDQVVVVGATNHVEHIDDALKRPGRFDLVARVTLPTLQDRLALLQRCTGRILAAPDLDLDVLARATAGLSHADIEGIVNRATVTAAEREAPAVTQEHLLRALERHQLGGEVSGMKALMTPADRHRIAVHEAGHALVAHALKAGIVERVTIEPRGQALGVTFMTRGHELPLYGERELKARLGMMLAGREAELLAFGHTTTGAADDLKRASSLAIQMVGQMGFSQAFGLLSVDGVPSGLMGPHLQERLLAEARTVLDEAQAACRAVLTQRRTTLDALTDALLACETVSGEPLQTLLDLQAAADPVPLPAP
ncbi:AAA family ATPase [uncultured Aquabacterium sp.]|uniref:AAA family ATPase n=1 Tax=Aquabacterium sp. TaxID=1872578 RepID=UPI0025F8E02A|nr:AAA family ATPase [uncultured Aquabacterium sp.]